MGIFFLVAMTKKKGKKELKRKRACVLLTAHNWQILKSILSCYCYKIYRVEAVDQSKNSNYTWKIKIFMNMWNSGHFFLKNRQFANNCLINLQIWKFFCTHNTHKTAIIFRTANFVSTLSIFSLIQISFPILRCLAQNHLVLLKDRFLKKMH